jgi:hypothetical protein
MCQVLACAAHAVKLAAQPLILSPRPSEYELLVARHDKQFRELAVKLAGGMSVGEWRDAMEAEIDEMHYQTHLIGQKISGNTSMDMAWARRVAAQMRDEESQYLNDFAAKIEDGGYELVDGGLNDDAVYSRQRLYLGKSRGTGNQAFVDASPIGSEWDWILGGIEEHCADCPVLAAGGPYIDETLYTTPGAGDTPCLGNCKCHIKRADGAVGILPIGVALVA